MTSKDCKLKLGMEVFYPWCKSELAFNVPPTQRTYLTCRVLLERPEKRGIVLISLTPYIYVFTSRPRLHSVRR